jgi:ferredoxin
MTVKSPKAKLILKNCIGCGVCVEVCPTYAIPNSLIGFISSLAEVRLDYCDGCGKCVEICSHGAIILLNHNH